MSKLISIITPVRNAATTIRDCLSSIHAQTSPIEHIVVDGQSDDGTLDIINQYRSHIAQITSEPDSGIYDAMNKGIHRATGDIVGILNADDFYVDKHVITKILGIFNSSSIDAVFADLVYVQPRNPTKIIRYYRGANFTLDKFAIGCMPPHPTFFIKRKCYLKYGAFKSNYKLAGDFELIARFMVQHGIRWHYFPEVTVCMRMGGASTKNFKSNLLLNREILKACTENGIKTNSFKIYCKYITKCMQLFTRPHCCSITNWGNYPITSQNVRH